jgi:prophage regulatory protein
MTSHQLLRLKQVEEKTGLKRSQIYLYMKEGTFPRSIKIGPASVAWLESEIDEWINIKLLNAGTLKQLFKNVRIFLHLSCPKYTEYIL